MRISPAQHQRGRSWLGQLLAESLRRDEAVTLDPAAGDSAASLVRVAPAIIVGDNGAPSHARRYDAVAIGAPSIRVSQGMPLVRPVGSEAEILAAAPGSLCLLVQQSSGMWAIWQADERIATTTCAAEPTAGEADAGAVAATSEQGRAVGQRSVLTLQTIVRSVVAASQQRIGVPLYAFPSGVIRIDAAVANLRLRSSVLTNTLRIGLGTVAASGSGTSLLPDHQDIVLQATTGAVTAEGLQVFYASPSKAVQGDVENITGLHVGVSTPVVVHLNIAPSSGWAATGDLLIEGAVELLWYRLDGAGAE